MISVKMLALFDKTVPLNFKSYKIREHSKSKMLLLMQHKLLSLPKRLT
jgi:hypothetical protein